ncbi:pyruvate/2-oxoacid:ferredoxin oxidoreductase beta subunit [Kibdelosporangium banguiense]|uniref:Pyruvate/2-oxoacid:ferredoxin oxidoreductase beta subunit n=1 Tax=Kibdelosporangium banguiense TaxID=1365924 RepID=A0ABS4TIR9_9PSEU|nr:thiamine pyrophosphate-dependent enzyme [Kibdelosporangium banguiense]MBP2324315.1 pyruvate/2-oxoacid:ferredoxin oxidoreductase beta subunit [Kibdelosporangium banguiense]
MTALDIGLRGLAGSPVRQEEIHWCSGCGDYAVLDTVQAYLPSLGLAREKIVLFSGIGCHAAPHYRDIDGVHSVHGRAPAIATGVAMGRPDLSVWVIIQDGHTMAAGGNHLINSLHTNVNIKVLLYDNKPDPLSLTCDMSFLGRVADNDKDGLTEVLAAAAHHRGSGLIQIRPAGPKIRPTGILRQVHRPTHEQRVRAAVAEVPELRAFL